VGARFTSAEERARNTLVAPGPPRCIANLNWRRGRVELTAAHSNQARVYAQRDGVIPAIIPGRCQGSP